jgi:hypothetical protein
MKNDYPISQLRIVKRWFHSYDNGGGRKVWEDSPHYMHESQVETFIAASIALHHSPGINPHNGNPTSALWEIKVAPLGEETSYWWCCPDLMANHSAQGAQINQALWSICFLTDRKWAHPILLAEEKKSREDEAKAEYEDNLRQIELAYK